MSTSSSVLLTDDHVHQHLLQDKVPLPSNMEKLPVELLSTVLHNVQQSGDDLRNVRLVSKQFSDIAERHMFNSLSVWLNRQSLERLVAVSQSRFGKHVQTLRFSTASLPSSTVMAEYVILDGLVKHIKHPVIRLQKRTEIQREDATDKINWNFTGMGVCTSNRVAAMVKLLEPLIDDLRDLLRSNGDPAYMATAFSNLHNLHTVEFGDDPEQENSSWGIKEIERTTFFSPRHMKDRFHCRLLGNFCSAAKSSVLRIQSLKFHDHSWYQRREPCCIQPGVAVIQAPSQIEAAKEAFQEVEDLQIPSCKGWDQQGFNTANQFVFDEDSRMDGLNINFVAFIKSMPQVNKLVSKSDSSKPSHFYPTIGRVLGFTKLVILTLELSSSCMEDFLILIATNRLTLKELNLVNVHVPVCGFEPLCSRLRNELALETFNVIGFIQEEDQHGYCVGLIHISGEANEFMAAVREFVLRKTLNFPAHLMNFTTFTTPCG